MKRKKTLVDLETINIVKEFDLKINMPMSTQSSTLACLIQNLLSQLSENTLPYSNVCEKL